MSALLQTSQPLQLQDFVNNLLQCSDSTQVRRLHCQTSGSEVVLRGCVDSPDAKLLAQRIVKSACGMRQISNEIIVLAELAQTAPK
jgi:osmotically-inducible protein OsmY